MKSRTLYFLATEGITDLSVSSLNGRSRLYSTLIDIIKNSGLFTMYGAYGDRVLLNGSYAYAHNLILEILITFGKFFGGIFIILYIFSFVKNILNKHCAGISGQMLLAAFVAFSVCRLFISSSFWYEPYFWGSIALMVTMNKHGRYKLIGLKKMKHKNSNVIK